MTSKELRDKQQEGGGNGSCLTHQSGASSASFLVASAPAVTPDTLAGFASVVVVSVFEFSLLVSNNVENRKRALVSDAMLSGLLALRLFASSGTL